MAIDLPGHGRSPRASAGVTLAEVAAACWAAVDDAVGSEPVILAGLSVGSVVAKYMLHRAPVRVRALVLTGGGYHDGRKGIADRHLDAYRDRGLEHKREHLFANFSTAFRDTDTARWFVARAMERNVSGDTDGTVALIRALDPRDPEWLHAGIAVPTLIVPGGADRSLPAQEELHRRIAGSELRVIAGAGHCCNIERPAEYDAAVLEFLRRRGLL